MAGSKRQANTFAKLMELNDLTATGRSNFELRRSLNLSENGRVRTVTLIIHALRPTSTNDAWTCECAIERIVTKPTRIFGVDALDSFLNCISFCRESLRNFNSEDRLVWWLEKGDEGGIQFK